MDWSSDVFSSDLDGEPQRRVPVAISVDIDEKTPDATDRNWQAERGAYREHRRPPRSRKLVRDAGRGPAPRWKPASCRSALNIGRLRSGFAAEDIYPLGGDEPDNGSSEERRVGKEVVGSCR